MDYLKENLILHDICSDDVCTGCGACSNICPRKAITLTKKINGFDYPSIDTKKCIGCNLCKQVCPSLIDNIINNDNKSTLKVYSATAKIDDFVLNQSSSGGFAYKISSYIIEAGGVAYGAAYLYNDSLTVRHVRID